MKKNKQLPVVLLLSAAVGLGLLAGGCQTSEDPERAQMQRLNSIQKQQIAELARENELLRQRLIDLQESNQQLKQGMASTGSETASAASTPEVAEPVAIDEETPEPVATNETASETAATAETTSEPVGMEETVSETAAETEAALASGEANIRILSLIPNPSGNERREESVTLINRGTAPGSLDGWRLKDLTSNFWQLDSGGVIGPGEQVTVRREGMNMGMNNTGDTIYLVNPDGETVQTVVYEELGDDEVVTAEE